ncbi:unnamed protein product [Pocillopora meandrina]|uniref:Uncharacterized protein n=1 Tax=Pocillopora meandrina TaxID=46732 RepID=A0AAU9X200_9CNID|nr:unnamed protein product [Pocillopora meandrina]
MFLQRACNTMRIGLLRRAMSTGRRPETPERLVRSCHRINTCILSHGDTSFLNRLLFNMLQPFLHFSLESWALEFI